jgi:hypothetical protein
MEVENVMELKDIEDLAYKSIDNQEDQCGTEQGIFAE